MPSSVVTRASTLRCTLVVPCTPRTGAANGTSTRTGSMATMRMVVNYLRLEPHVLHWRGVRKRRDELEAAFLHAGPNAADEAVLPNRREDNALNEDLLDLVQQLFALPAIELARLTLEEIVHFGQCPVRKHAALRRQAFDSGGRVASRTLRAQHNSLQLLFAPGREPRGPFHCPEPDPDADRAEVASYRFGEREVRRIRRDVSAVEAIRVASLGQELLGTLWIVRMRIDRQCEFHVTRHDAPGEARESECLRLVDRLAVDGEACGQPDPLIVPRRFRIPLIDEVEKKYRIRHRGTELEAGRAPDVFRDRSGEVVRDVDFAPLERGGAGCLVRNALEDNAFHAGCLAPIPVERFEHQLDAGRLAHEPVRAGADRRLDEAIVANLLNVLLRHDPSRARGGGAVERHEIGPWLLHHESHVPSVDDSDFLDPLFQEPPTT